MSALKNFFKRIYSFARRYASKGTLIAIVIVLAFASFAAIKAIQSKDTSDQEEPSARAVQTATLSSLSANGSTLEVVGTVKSKNQADLRAQSAGVINYIGASVGSYVSAGTIIASIENASERASVQQAQAGVAQAQAQLNKVLSGARDEELAVLRASTIGAGRTYDESGTSARNALTFAYTTIVSSFEGGVDESFNDADGSNPNLKFKTTNGSSALAAQNARFTLQGKVLNTLSTRSARVSFLDETGLIAELTQTESELRKIKTFLDSLVTSLDGAIVTGTVSSSDISSYTSSATSARSNVLSTLSTLSSARSGISSAQTALVVAQESEDQGVSGAREEDIQVAQAQVDSAKASLAQALASLEEKRIRTLVSGTLTTFSLERGSFVTSFEQVGVVANEGALEVSIFVPTSEASKLSIGDTVIVGQIHEGTIASIAKGLDQTRRQIEVRVAVSASPKSLPNGSSTTVSLLLKGDVQTVVGSNRIPISALKLVGNDAFVFTISFDGTLVAHAVEVGAVDNTHVEIQTNLPPDTIILTDARGFNEGDAVIVE